MYGSAKPNFPIYPIHQKTSEHFNRPETQTRLWVLRGWGSGTAPGSPQKHLEAWEGLVMLQRKPGARGGREAERRGDSAKL